MPRPARPAPAETKATKPAAESQKPAPLEAKAAEAQAAEAKVAEAKVVAPAAAQPQIRKSEQVRQAWRAHPRKEPKEITAMLQAQGLDVSSGYVSQIKFQMNKKKGKKPAKAGAAPASAASPTKVEAAPALLKDAVSLALLQKAKKLAMDLGGVKEAKQAMDALAQLLD